MAAGDRNKKGQATDIVRHYGFNGDWKALCGRKEVGYVTNNIDDVTCKNCLKKFNQQSNG